jgi:hypothetical protein
LLMFRYRLHYVAFNAWKTQLHVIFAIFLNNVLAWTRLLLFKLFLWLLLCFEGLVDHVAVDVDCLWHMVEHFVRLVFT